MSLLTSTGSFTVYVIESRETRRCERANGVQVLPATFFGYIAEQQHLIKGAASRQPVSD